jgi:Flp pilus assembly protein CpaB
VRNRIGLGAIVIVLGIVLVALGVLATRQIFSQSVEDENIDVVTGEVITNEVVILTHDVPLGKLIQEQDIEIVEVPIVHIPRNTVTDLELALGRFTRTDLIEGQMLLENNLANPTTVRGDLAYILEDDHFLVTLPATDLMSSLNIIKRGDIVDLLVTAEQAVDVVTAAGGEEETITKQITYISMQKLNITALIANVITESDPAPSQAASTPEDADVTLQSERPDGILVLSQVKVVAYLLALPPQDALVLKYLLDSGADIDFAVRSPTSTETYDLDVVTDEYIKEIFGLEIIQE